MNPVLKCDGERRALLLDYHPAECQSTTTTSTTPKSRGRKNSGGYGSIAAQQWLMQGDEEKPASEMSDSASSTCCSSSDDEYHPSQPVDLVMSRSTRFSDHPVVVVLPDDEEESGKNVDTNDDKAVVDDKPDDDPSNILKHQNTSLTASTSTCTATSIYDDEDLELGGVVGTDAWDVSESPMMDLLAKNGMARCGVGRELTFPGWEAYNHSLDENPVITKAFTSLTGWFVGDLLTQTIITGDAFDVHRSIVLASFGFFFHGPVGHVIYDNMDRIIVGTGPREIAAKIMIDQVLWCPIFMVCYFTYLGLANGDSPSLITGKIHSDLWTAVLGSWKVWILAHAIQFRYVQTKHRIVYINCIEVCFIMFLSFLGNR